MLKNKTKQLLFSFLFLRDFFFSFPETYCLLDVSSLILETICCRYSGKNLGFKYYIHCPQKHIKGVEMACFMDNVMSQGEMSENGVWSQVIIVTAFKVHAISDIVVYMWYIVCGCMLVHVCVCVCIHVKAKGQHCMSYHIFIWLLTCVCRCTHATAYVWRCLGYCSSPFCLV